MRKTTGSAERRESRSPTPRDALLSGRGSAGAEGVMDTAVFYRGLLFALRLEGFPDTFDTEGERFHRAFGETIKYARSIRAQVPLDELQSFDPMFGHYR